MRQDRVSLPGKSRVTKRSIRSTKDCCNRFITLALIFSAGLNIRFLLLSNDSTAAGSGAEVSYSIDYLQLGIGDEREVDILLNKYAEQDGPETTPPPLLSHQEAQEFVKQRFSDAGIDLDDATLQSLPTWNDIVQNIGETPRIYGLDQCERYRSLVPALERLVGATGVFSTGTNLATELLTENCQIPERVKKYGSNANDTMEKWHMKVCTAHGMLWQVPWGKHTPAWKRFNKTAPTYQKWNKEAILPIVTIRHPYTWMASMCHTSYEAVWPHSKICPHLVKSPRSMKPVNVKIARDNDTYDSLAHFWNDWYQEYWKVVDFPFLMVRHEDLIFHAENITTEICICAGGVIRPDRPFFHVVKSAKPTHDSKLLKRITLLKGT